MKILSKKKKIFCKILLSIIKISEVEKYKINDKKQTRTVPVQTIQYIICDIHDIKLQTNKAANTT